MTAQATIGREHPRTKWARDRRRAIAYGRWNPTQLVDPAPVREHIAELRAFGLSLEAIAVMAGEHPTSLSTLVQPGHAEYLKYVTDDRAERLLAVRFDLNAVPAGKRVSMVGTTRRIEALAYMGWSQKWVADQMGMSVQAVSQFRAAKRPTITVENARTVRDLFDTHAMTPGPWTKSARWARSHGWLPPLAWDDIDDPREVPNMGADTDTADETAVERLVEGRPVTATDTEKAAALAILVSNGIPDAEIAARLRVSDRTVLRWRQRDGLETRWVA